MKTSRWIKRESTWGKVLTAVLVLLILGGISALAHSVAVPFEEPFTEFYLLGTNGKAEGYPTELKVGEKGRVLVGIVNHEYQDSRYFFSIRIDGEINTGPVEITLKHGEKWEEEVTFSLSVAGDGQKVEFLLNIPDSDNSNQELYLLLDVK